jgi:excisionase family DNA binding protein
MSAEPLLLMSREAAKLLAVSERTLWGLTVPRGPIPTVKIGRCVRFALTDLQAFVAACRRSADIKTEQSLTQPVGDELMP